MNRVDPFDLPLGIRFRYPGADRVWVIIGRVSGNLVIAELTSYRNLQQLAIHRPVDGVVELAEELP